MRVNMSMDLSKYLSSELKSPETQVLFRRVAYAFLLGHALFFTPVFPLLFGPDSVLMSWNLGDSPGFSLAGLLDHKRHLAMPSGLLYLVCLLLALFDWGGAFVRFLVFLLGVMLYYAALPAFTAVFILYNLFAAYLVFLNPKARTALGIAFSNLAFAACKLQFVMVYALTGGYKLAGHTWIEGSALHHAIHLPQYTPLWMRSLMDPWPRVMQFLSWFGMGYQLAFPFFVWIKRIKTPFLLAGVLFHLYIAVAMRLPEFGMGMIMAYSLFFDQNQARYWNRLFSKIGRRTLRLKTTPE